MTIIELNIAGLHITHSAPSRRAIKRSWQRNYRAWRQNAHWSSALRAGAHRWPAAVLRPRAASDSPAA